jgi:hypothetical protein
MNFALLTQQGGELRGGEPLQTRLMSSVEMIPATQEGVEGTFIKAMVAAELAVVVPTRNAAELSRRRVEIVGELADHTLQALSEVGRKDSAQQRMMQRMLSDQMKSLDLRKVPGVKGLVVTGDDGDPAERVLGASLALGRAVREGTASALEDVPEPSSDEMEASYEPVQKYVAETMAALGGRLDVETKGPPPPPPLPSA